MTLFAVSFGGQGQPFDCEVVKDALILGIRRALRPRETDIGLGSELLRLRRKLQHLCCPITKTPAQVSYATYTQSSSAPRKAMMPVSREHQPQLAIKSDPTVLRLRDTPMNPVLFFHGRQSLPPMLLRSTAPYRHSGHHRSMAESCPPTRKAQKEVSQATPTQRSITPKHEPPPPLKKACGRRPGRGCDCSTRQHGHSPEGTDLSAHVDLHFS